MAVALTAAAVLGGAAHRADAQAPTPTARALSATEALASVESLLERAGVPVLPDRQAFGRGLAPPVAGYAVSAFQARGMAAEIAGGSAGGFLGADLDEIAPLPAGAPPISYLLAAWMALGSTPAARDAAELMGTREWTRAPFLVYPGVVLAAFVGDALRHGEAAGAENAIWRTLPFERPAWRGRATFAGLGTARFAQADAGPCGAINSFVDSVLATVFNKIKIDAGGGGAGGFFASLFNKAVDLVGVVVKGVVQVITAPIAEGMRIAIGIVGVVSYAGSLLKPWSLTVSADPRLLEWAVEGKPAPEGSVTARPNGVWLPTWPPELVACAKLVDLDLPASNADVGSPVKWIGAGPGLAMIQRTYRDEALPADGVAKYRFKITKSETKQESEKGEPVDSPLTIEVHLERKLVKEMQKFLEGLFLGSIPKLAAPVLKPILTPIVAKVLAKLGALLRVNGSTRVTIRRHQLARCPLFTAVEAEETLGIDFDTLALIPPTGCAVGVRSGPKLGYYYSAASCELAATSVALVGVTPLDLGPASFYLHSGDSHVLGFPSVKHPNRCVLINASPLAAFKGGRIVLLAKKMRPRS